MKPPAGEPANPKAFTTKSLTADLGGIWREHSKQNLKVNSGLEHISPVLTGFGFMSYIQYIKVWYFLSTSNCFVFETVWNQESCDESQWLPEVSYDIVILLPLALSIQRDGSGVPTILEVWLLSF